MTFEEFKEINKKYGLSRMWTDGLENIAKEEYEEHVKHLAEVFEDIFNDDSDEEDFLMAKKYEYDGMIYCEDDLSEQIDNYGGDLYELFSALAHDHLADDVIYYYATEGENNYETYEELIESEFSDLEVNENE